ncbi:MAG: alkaline phosphatase, partial [Magnetococcales bacterium]|nr:alkaline phosphatase [Magnetococcales bacterium]
ILDASPAGFSGIHIKNRKDYNKIAEQYPERGFDMLLGGGCNYFLPREKGGKRDDQQDLISRFRKEGYAYAEDRKGLAQLSGTKILGLFAKDDFPMETERDPQQTPSLAEMTDKILSLLATDNNPQGFFAFIENELTDSAGHASDAANMLLHTLDFDQAVQVAHTFQIKHPDTLLIVTTDHDTGAFSLSPATKGVTQEGAKVKTYPPRTVFDKISQVHVSMDKVAEELGETPTGEQLDRIIAQRFPGFSLDADLREKILKRETLSRTHTYPVTNILGEMVARHTQMFWGTSGHTNAWPFIIAVGPGAERFAGFLDNTTFGKNLSQLLQGK